MFEQSYIIKILGHRSEILINSSSHLIKKSVSKKKITFKYSLAYQYYICNMENYGKIFVLPLPVECRFIEEDSREKQRVT